MKASPRLSSTAVLVALASALAVSCGLSAEGLPPSGSTGTSAHTSTGAAGSNGSGNASSGSAGSTSSSSGGSPIVWQSWDMDSATQTAPDTTGMHPAMLLMNISNSTMDLSGVKLMHYVVGINPFPSNNVMQYWTPLPGTDFPYVGKSSIGRGLEPGEMGTSLGHDGVNDLQAFPPTAMKLTVVAFVVPIAGDYVLSELAARRVSSQGDTSTFRVYLGDMGKPSAQVGQPITAHNDQRWVPDNMSYPLTGLKVDDHVSFTVDSDGNFDNDATEISWVLTTM